MIHPKSTWTIKTTTSEKKRDDIFYIVSGYHTHEKSLKRRFVSMNWMLKLQQIYMNNF